MQTLVARIQETLSADFTTQRGVTVALPNVGRRSESAASARKILAVLDRDKPPDAAFFKYLGETAAATAGRVTFVSVGEGSGEHYDEFDINPVVLWGEPAHRICHYADFMDADVIAIHEKPRSFWSRLWWKSIADEVQALSNRPVQLINPDREAPNQCRTILCVVNLDGSDDELLEYTKNLALRSDADIALLHVLPELSEGTLSASAGRSTAPLSVPVAEERMGWLTRRLPMRSSSHVLVGPESRSIGRAASDLAADLVIVGRPKSEFWDGSWVDPAAVLRYTRCSVLSVPTSGARKPNEKTYAKVTLVLRDLAQQTDS